MARRIEQHNLGLAGGLATNFTPESVAGKYLLSCKNMDGFGVFRGIGTVPGSTRVSADHGGPVASLHQHEYFDLAGDIQREQLSVAGTSLYRIESNLSLTSLYSSLTAAERLNAQRMLNRLHLSGPGQLGLPTGGIKYDGDRATNWGVLAPGTEETVIENIDDHTDWTASAQGSISTNADVSKTGLGSVQLDKLGVGGVGAALSRTSSGTTDLSNINTVFLWCFLPAGILQKLGSTGSIAISLGNSSSANDSFLFYVGDVVPGWNLLTIDYQNPDFTTGSPTRTAIDYTAITITVTGAAVTFTGMLFSKLYYVDNGLPAVGVDTPVGAGITGTFSYRVTFLTEYGLESNAGPSSAAATPSSQEVNLSGIPVSADDQVVARRIYRDSDSDNIYRFVAQIDDNSTTTFRDETPTASLGDEPPIAGDEFLDHSPPGRFYTTALHQNRIIGVDADNRFILRISQINTPEAFAIVDELQLEEEITALSKLGNLTLIHGTDKLFILSGDGVSTSFRADEVNSQLGANGRTTLAQVKSLCVTMREKEVFLIADPRDPWYISGPIQDLLNALPGANLASAHVQHDRSRFRLVFFTSDGSDFNDPFVFQYGVSGEQMISGDGPGVDPQDIRHGGWFRLELPSNVNPQCSEMVERTADTPELWIGGNDGYVYYLQDPAAASYANAASTAAISQEWESAAVPLGVRPGALGEPRYLEIDYVNNTGQASTWACTVTRLTGAGGATIGTPAAFNISIPDGAGTLQVGTPSQARGEWAKVKLTNATSGDKVDFTTIRLGFIPRRADFRGARAS